VDFEYLAGGARLNETVSDLLAAAGWLKLLNRKLSNTSKLHWATSSGGRAAGYEIPVRKTNAPL
jgi:hypothetical protein